MFIYFCKTYIKPKLLSMGFPIGTPFRGIARYCAQLRTFSLLIKSLSHF